MYWLIGLALKRSIKTIFFQNINNQDFNNFINYTLDLLPNEKLSDIFFLLVDLIKIKPSQILKFNNLKEIINHTLPSTNRNELINPVEENNKLKYFFILFIIWDILKRFILLIKKIIIFPFKLGVYSFIAFLFGIKVDYLLSFFDYFNFNIPAWTYNKLLDLHLNWLNWLKNIFQINSISTEDISTNSAYSSNKNTNISLPLDSDIKPKTYLYLTKTQWLYLSCSLLTAFAAYSGYTFGIPFTKSWDWSSDNNNNNQDKGEGTSDGGVRVFPIRNINDKTWQDTFTEYTNKLGYKIEQFYYWVTTKKDKKGKGKASDDTSSTSSLDLEDSERNRFNKLSEDLHKNKIKEHFESKGIFIRDSTKPNLGTENSSSSSTKKSSPTHDDPIIESERQTLFQYPQPEDYNPFSNDNDVTPTQSTILKKPSPSSSNNSESPQGIGTESSSPISEGSSASGASNPKLGFSSNFLNKWWTDEDQDENS